MSTQTTPAALLNELARLQRESKRLRDLVTRQRQERRRLAIARIVERAQLDALVLITVAVGGGEVGRDYSPLPQRRWAYATGLLRMAGLTTGGRDLHVDTRRPHAELVTRLHRAAQAAVCEPRRYVAELPPFLVPALLREHRAE